MDNLTLRRILVAIGMVIILAASVLLAYGIFTGNNTYIMVSIVAVVIAYLISRYVTKLQKENRSKQK